MSGIGLLNEKPLHASLKQWYARPGDRIEVPVDGFVIDIVRDDLLIEIQTRNFASLKSKLTKLARSHPVRLVYPIIQGGLSGWRPTVEPFVASHRKGVGLRIFFGNWLVSRSCCRTLTFPSKY